MENLARYIIRASFSQERMTYLPEESRIIYRSKDNRQEKSFDALDWLAAMTSHIPDQREQMVRYYGFYSNASRGLRQKENQDALIPCIIEPAENAKPNRNCARLIQKIYEVDPLTCPKCQGLMRIISIIEDQEVVNKILGHLGLWQTNQGPHLNPKLSNFRLIIQTPSFLSMRKPLIGVLRFLQITPPFKGNSGSRGSSSSKSWQSASSFPFISLFLKSPTLHSPVFFRRPPLSPRLPPCFSLDCVFFAPYTLHIKKQVLSNQMKSYGLSTGDIIMR